MAKRFLYNHFFRYVLAIFPRLQYTEFGSAPDPEHLQDMHWTCPLVGTTTGKYVVKRNGTKRCC